MQKSVRSYEIYELIEEGGFGVVYRAGQIGLDRQVAIKVILPHYANQPEFIRRFETEASIMAKMEHSHIVPIYDYWRDSSGAYLVMRYFPAGSLRSVIRNEAYTPGQASRVLDQICSALSKLHQSDIVHRDIKPGNILLDEDGNAFLSDFGIVRDLRKPDPDSQTDKLTGSMPYMSPEQARSDAITAKTDIYSLGVTLYEMLTGEHPFKGISAVEQLYKHINDPLPEIRNLPEDRRNAINAVIQKATAKNPAHRYDQAFDMANAFREAVAIDSTTVDVAIIESLTLREHDVLRLLAEGLSNQQIADAMFVQKDTVRKYLQGIYKKLGANNRVQAILRARELELLGTSDILTRSADYDQDAGSSSGVSVMLPEPENPYKGLHAFHTNDARDFFGRTRLVNKLIARMEEKVPGQRFLAIVGPSGSGKSSLVLAGLVPALRNSAIPGSRKWFVADLIPDSHPIDKLETTLIQLSTAQSANFGEHLQRDARGLLRVADILLPRDDSELLIIIDQFEEVFTQVEDEEMRQKFLDLLCTAALDERGRVRIIITLRADYFDRPLHYAGFGELLRNRIEMILPLSAQELERAIVGPVERMGLTFEQGLVPQIIEQVHYQAGALPLLQFTLHALFEQREDRVLTQAAYDQLGGVVGALAKRADAIYLAYDPELREVVQQIFMRLVILGEGSEDTRRRAQLRDLLLLNRNVDLVEEIIDEFVNKRLLLLDHDPQTRQPTVEVAHEAILREWDRLRHWINESRDDIRRQQALAHSAAEWYRANQEASFLMMGSKLRQFETWANETSLILMPDERAFLDASLDEREQHDTLERKRLEKQIALERQSRSLLRALVLVFALAALLSGGFGVFALDQRDDALVAQDETEFALDIARRSGLAFAANAAVETGNMDLAVALLMQSVGDDPENLLPETLDVIEKVASQGGPYTFIDMGWPTCAAIESFTSRRVSVRISCDWSEWAAWDLAEGKQLAVAPFPGGDIYPWGIGPDLRLMAVETGAFDTAPAEVAIYDLNTLEVINRLSLDTVVFEGRWADADTLVTLDAPGSEAADGVNAGTFAPGGQRLSFWDVRTGELKARYSFEGANLYSVAFSSDGELGAVLGLTGFEGPGSDYYLVMIFDRETGQVVNQFERSPVLNPENPGTFINQPGPIIFRNDGGAVWFGGSPAYIIDIETGEDIFTFPEFVPNLHVFGPSEDFQYIEDIVDGVWYIGNILTGEEYRVGGYNVVSLGALPGTAIIRQLGTSLLILYDVLGRENIAHIIDFTPRQRGQSQNLSFSPDGRSLGASLGQCCETFWTTGHTIIYHADSFEEAYRLETDSSLPFVPPFWSPNGRYVGAATFDEGIIIADAETGAELMRLVDPAQDSDLAQDTAVAPQFHAQFTPDSRYLVSAWNTVFTLAFDRRPELLLWDVETGEIERRIELPLDIEQTFGMRSLNMHPSRNEVYVGIRSYPFNDLASASPQTSPVYRVNLDTGQVDEILTGMLITDFALTPDGGELVAISDVQADILVIDTETLQVRRRWGLGEVSRRGIAISPDARYLATGTGSLSSKFEITIWDFQTGDFVRTLRVNATQSFILTLSFSPDGKYLVSSSTDGRGIVWNFDSQPDLEWILENRGVRELTCEERKLYRVEPLCP